MKIIGLTGGVGSGKSTVAHILEEKYGAYLCIADEIGHKAMKIGEKPYYQIVEFFGRDILNKDLGIDREKLGRLVFQDNKKLNILNSFIHPYVYDYISHTINQLRKKGTIPFVIVESAILIEAGYTMMCDEIWYVSASKETRKKRLMEERGYTLEKIQGVMENQLSEDEFCKKSTRILYNDGDEQAIYRQLEIFLV